MTFRDRDEAGFTLIEVLVAMTIVVVSLVAIFGVIMQMVSAVTLMQEKTFSSWVAMDRITEMRVAGEFPEEDKISGTTEMAGVSWSYDITLRSETDGIRQVIVRVAPEDEPERELGLATGVLVQTGTGAPQLPGSGQGSGRGAEMQPDGDLQ